MVERRIGILACSLCVKQKGFFIPMEKAVFFNEFFKFETTFPILVVVFV